MSDIRIEVFNGLYDNYDAYERLLGYISNKTDCSGYGFNCSLKTSIIEQFRLSETCSHHTNAQKIWHFTITFAERWKHTDLLQIAVKVSSLFASEYQVLFGLDTEKGRPHLHFGVNAFSYHPDAPVLSKDKMYPCLVYIQQLLEKLYPNKTVTLQFQGKRGNYV